MIIGVPSGIGDISWLISKLINAKEWPEIEILVADGWPFRAKDYLDMIGAKYPPISDSCPRSPYGIFRFDDIVMWNQEHKFTLWKQIRDNGFGMNYLQNNHFLEMGYPLAEYFPDLPTSYHYPLNLPDITKKKFYPSLLNMPHPLIGISAASYRGHSAWKTWPLSEWSELCNMLINDGYAICLMGGAWDDLTDALESELPPNMVVNVVGKTSFSEAMSIHKLCPYYIGFSSGLGIIRTVMSLPTIMLWPEHQQPLSTSWADPDDLDRKMYVACSYMEPKVVYNFFKRQERTYMV